MEALEKLRAFLSPDEYLRAEREAESRSEYLDGEVYAMAGGSPEHSAICFNLATIIGAQLRGKPCRGFSSDMKVRTRPKKLFAYPDLTVVCGEPTFHDDRRDVLANPKVLFEVLSPSTETYDRGGKWLRYQQIESLTDYVLIAQDRPLVEHYTRQDETKWLYRSVIGLEGVLELPSIDCRISLTDLYDRIAFPDPSPET